MKNRAMILGVTILIVGMLLATAMPANTGDDGGDKRVIVDSTSAIDKFVFKMKGCTIVHELNDATALKCPAGVTIANAREDRIFQIVDLEADQQIGADLVWDQGITGAGVTVAVLDTGIDMDHPELEDNYLGGHDYVDDDETPEDWHGHGTHVAGIISANGVNADAKGVAPGAGIYMYKVCGPYGCYESDMVAAMESAVLTDARVMSISIGGGNFPGENCDSDSLAAKVNWVADQGITVVVAAGNDKFLVSSPACASGAIAVGAVDKTGLMASFSNFGPALDIVAPGVSIYSSVIDGYAYMSGTSMSTPHVSGTVALMLENNPTLTVEQIKTALYETADPINTDSICYGIVKQLRRIAWVGVVECTSDNYGAGIVDAYGAVNYLNQVEPVCGDGKVNQATEQCDGFDLSGKTCKTLGFDGGTLVCTETCAFDTSGCITTTGCGDGYCAGATGGEDCNTCPEDCPSKTVGRNPWCCGDEICTGKGEDADSCPIDCT